MKRRNTSNRRASNGASESSKTLRTSKTNVDYDVQSFNDILKLTPYKHQVEAMNLGINKPNFALIADMGTGKTLVIVGVAGKRYLDGELKRLLVICPVSAVGVWKREFKKHAKYEYRFTSLRTQKKLQKKVDKIKRWKDGDGLQVVAVNYESVWRAKRRKRGRALKSQDLKAQLCRWLEKSDSMVVVDESHRLKNPNSKQSRGIYRIGLRADYRSILTGTPVESGPLDYFGQYRFLDSKILGTDHSKFIKRYGVKGGYMGKQVVGQAVSPMFKGEPNPYYDEELSEEFFKKVHRIAYRITKAEALDLPPELEQTYRVQLEPKARRLYDEMEQEAIVEIGGKMVTAPIVLTKLLRLHQISGGFAKTEDGSSIQISKAKLDALDELLQELGSEKVVVFVRFIPELNAIKTLLKRAKLSCTTISGKVVGEERDRRIDKFHKPKGPRILIAQQTVGAESIDLTAACYDVFYSVDRSLIKYEQAKARTYRGGQTRPVTHINIVAEDTVDEVIRTDLINKREVAGYSTDIVRRLLRLEP